MSQSRTTPIFNLKAVVQETGLKPDTLRAWERRYGIPEPQRTPSGHRLYTQRDIETLKWLLARLDDGLSISRAVALWHELEKETGDPLDVHAAVPARESHATALVAPVPKVGNGDFDTLSNLRQQWLTACLAFDEQSAEMVLSSAFALLPVEKVCQELIQSGLAALGEGWYQGTVTVQQEHFASALALRRIDALLASAPPPTRPKKILVGCPPEEAHTFIPLMLTLLLRRRGWHVLYLGADVPVQSLELTVKTMRPALVVLTAQQLYTAAGLLEMSQVLLAEHVPLGFGGRIFTDLPALRDKIPGHFLGSSVDTALRHVEQLVSYPRALTTQIAVPRASLDALHHYQERKARIEADVWKSMEHTGMPQRHLAAANTNFGRNIIAALSLGDVELLGHDLAWIEGMLVNHYQMPVHLLDDYLDAYYAASRTHLTPRGQPLLDWFAQLLGDAERDAANPASNRTHTSSTIPGRHYRNDN